MFLSQATGKNRVAAAATIPAAKCFQQHQTFQIGSFHQLLRLVRFQDKKQLQIYNFRNNVKQPTQNDTNGLKKKKDGQIYILDR